MFMHCEGELIR